MSKTFDQIENYIQLHTAEMEDEEYLEIVREVARWANRQLESYTCRVEDGIDDSFNE